MANARYTMGNEEKKEYLKQYRKACKKLKTLQEQAESLQEVQSSAKVQRISDMPKGHSGQSDLSDIIVKFEELQRKINDKIKESLALRLEIENAILTVEDTEEEMVLKMRYIEFRHWEDIAKAMRYSIRHVYRIHGQALRDLQIKKMQKN